MGSKKALLIIDVQNDFCPGGALPVPKGDKVVAVLNRYIQLFKKQKLPILATRDWHPKKSRHFKEFGGKWPPHCVQNTKGARFHPRLKLTRNTIVLSGGTKINEDGYSAFDSRDPKGKPIVKLLKKLGVEELYIGGLATEYCVKFSVLDALRNGFKVKLLSDAIRGIDLKQGDSKEAIRKMIARGAKKITFSKI